MSEQEKYNEFLEGAPGDYETAARYLGCSPGTLKQWVSKRKVPHSKAGRLVRFYRAKLDGWLDARYQPAKVA